MTIKSFNVVALASVFLFLVAIVFRSSRWKTISSASGVQADELQDKHTFLEAQGLRCRLRTEEIQSDAGSSGSGSGPLGYKPYTLVLQVHEEDVKLAADALVRYKRNWFAGESRAL